MIADIGQSFILSVTQPENLDQPCNVKCSTNKGCGRHKEDRSVVFANTPYCIDENSERGAIEVRNFREIDDDVVSLMIDEFAQRVSEGRARVQIDLTFEMDQGYSVF